MLPIAHSPYARDVAAWVAGGDQKSFKAALAAHEQAAWMGGHTGDVDESMATFDEHEWRIARCLARQGHNVIALPPRPVAALRSPDAAVSGLLVEFKTYRGTNPRQLLRKVGEARPQADRAVIGVEAQWDPAMMRSIFRAAIHSAIRCRMLGMVFIGDDFQFEWGDWNPCVDPTEESTMGAQVPAPRHRPVRRLQLCPTPPLSLRI